MKYIDTFMLVVGAFWIFMATPYLISLLPAGQRLAKSKDVRVKGFADGMARISRLRRVVYVLFCGLYAAVGFASAFHHSFSSPAIVLLMILLPGLSLVLGIRDTHFQSRHGPGAGGHGST